MKTPLPKDDLRRALEGLKDFQRKTVDHVFQRMYLDAEPARRMLISDEVGLGKTLVARGVIAKALEHLWGRVPRIDVVYICSNGDIARQNVNRLQVLAGEGMRSATRLTLLASQLPRLGEVNFIALTPGTSFDLGTNLGVASERAMLYWLLREVWGFGGHAAPFNVLRGNALGEGFRTRVHDEKPEQEVLQAVSVPFAAALARQPDLKVEFDALCDLFGRDRKHIPPDQAQRRNAFVGKVRAVLAETCVDALSPDLVILDEFQRFKHLMNDESDAGLLARKMFNYADSHGEAKVLLLSATPYKMLTLASQGDAEDHYSDFLDTLKFLQPDTSRFSGLKRSVDSFRLGLLRLRNGGSVDEVLASKSEMERGLREVIVRTERLTATEDRSGMLSEVPLTARLGTDDAEAYVIAQEIADIIGDRDVMEYWKSAPYVLNFLEGYKIRDRLRNASDDPVLGGRLAERIGRRPRHFLSAAAIRNLEPISSANARLRAILSETVDKGAWRMLWMPPCMPEYSLAGAFCGSESGGFTKQLVFSSWRMVPRAVATLVSHAADYQAITAFDLSRGKPSAGASRWPTSLLRFQLDAGNRLTGMPLFTLLYPSRVLADLGLTATMAGRTGEKLPSADEVLGAAEAELAVRLTSLSAQSRTGMQPDERWYWMAPLLLDLEEAREETVAWLSQRGLAGIWEGQEPDEEDSGHWRTHVERFIEAARTDQELGPMPADLARVLAEASIGSSAVAAYQALRRFVSDDRPESMVLLRNQAASIGWGMRNLFNLPESIAILRGISDVEPYWRRVLQYGVEGGIRAVFDEYFHVLRESLGLSSAPAEKILIGIGAAVRDALGLRSGSIGVDEFRVDAGGNALKMETNRLRARFAMPFADAKPEEQVAGAKGEIAVTRMEKVREAFNSPFWPFVLVSTSVGQEGLDFHPYCHSVVHWNLPSNPVDLEQREGRVHRYKGHAVRKNIARAFGTRAFTSGSDDPWSMAFELARQSRAADASDMVPYWIFPLEGGAKIERRVAALPLSRDMLRMTDLRKTLAVYRLVFGQPRQEDLLEFLTSRFDGEELRKICDDLRVDLSPG